MADRKKSAEKASRPSSKVSKASVKDAVTKLTAKALREFKLNDEDATAFENQQEEGAGEFYYSCFTLLGKT